MRIGSLVSWCLTGVSGSALALDAGMKTFRVVETPFINYIVDVRDSSRSLKAYIRGRSLHEEKYANDTARERVLNAVSPRERALTLCIRNPLRERV